MEDALNPQRVFDILVEWMKEDQIFIQEMPHPQALRAMEILIGPDLRANVVVPATRQNRIVILCAIEIPPEQRDALKQLGNEEFADYWYDLFETIITLGADFQASRIGKDVKTVTIIVEILFEEFFSAGAISKPMFFDKLSIVRRATLFVVHNTMYYTGYYPHMLGLSLEEGDEAIDDKE